MSRQFPARYEVTAAHMGAAIADYSRRTNSHNTTAHELAQAQTNEAGVTCWESPQQLRIVAHELELAQECQQAMFDCGAIRTLALMKAYAHACWCKVRAVLVSNFDPKLQTLAQVAASFTALSLPSSAPPGKSFSLNVLATCHASNAPGLSRIAMTSGRSSPASS